MHRFRDIAARGHFTPLLMTDSERASMTSWYRSTVTFYLGCMVSEMTRFYCQPDMTSSWFLRLAFHTLFMTNSERVIYDFLKAVYINFFSCHAWFPSNEVLLPTGYDVIVSPPSGVLWAIFHDEFRKIEHDFRIAFHINFYLGCMVSELTRFYPPGDVSLTFSWRILKERPWLPDSVP